MLLICQKSVLLPNQLKTCLFLQNNQSFSNQVYKLLPQRQASLTEKIQKFKKQTNKKFFIWLTLNTQTCHLPMYVFSFLEIPTEVGIVPQWVPCAEATDSCNSSSFLSWSFLIPSKILAVIKRIHQCTSHLFSFNLLL